MIGKVIGKLTIVEKIKNTRSGIFRCICACGNEKIIDGRNVYNQKSCGCSKKGNQNSRKAYGEASFNNLYNRYIYSAKKRNIEFRLSKEEFRELTKLPCYYCGEPPSRIVIKPTFYGEYTYNGIDRIDNNIGYLKENCLSCCYECNIMKSDHNRDTFLNRIKLIYERRVL